jgi:hypothetical protein
MGGETVTWWGILGAVGAGIVIAILIALAINAWNKPR